MSDRHFSPYVRRGLVRTLTNSDPLEGGLDAGVVELAVEIGSTPIPRTVNLEPATTVTSLAPGAVVRRWPSPGADDAETNFFPIVELADADLPWRYTPAAAATRGRLRPWLALIAVDVESDIELVAEDAGYRLSVPLHELTQLPEPSELWGWAHVQSSAPTADLATLLNDDPTAAFSRLVCPRVLEPARTYLCAIVAAFAAGEAGGVVPAWDPGQTIQADLVVYDHWTFSTAAEDGDFESLCERLAPAAAVSDLGVATVDFREPGFKVDGPLGVDKVAFPLQDIGSTTRLPAGSKEFATSAEQLMERPPDPPTRGYNPLRDDPVVGLPPYGMHQAGVDSLPAKAGWMRNLNLRPDHRLAAGLGATVVRHNQEELVAAAWDHAGALREVRDEANRLRLAAEVDRSVQARVAQLESGPRIAAAAALITFIAVDDQPARELMAQSATPSVVADRAWLRRAPVAVAADATNVLVEASDPSSSTAVKAVLDVFTPGTVGGLVQRGETFAESATQFSEIDIDISHVDPERLKPYDSKIVGSAVGTKISVPRRTAATVSSASKQSRRVRSERIATTAPPGGIGQPGTTLPPGGQPGSTLPSGGAAQPATTAVAEAISARPVIANWRTTLVSRAPAVAAQTPEGELVSAVVGAPRFEDGLINDLVELEPELAVPGIGDFPDDSVRLLAANASFITSLLVGANHEIGRELLWRGYPVDQSATFFARFFDHHDGTDDIAPIASWKPKSSLEANMPAAASISVVLVRGALIRRFPDVATFVAPPAPAGKDEADMAAAVPPIFQGLLDDDTAFFGFPVAPDELRGQTKGAKQGEWFVGFEERFEATRFGLDLTGPEPLASWLELGRNHFRDLGTHVPADRIPGIGKPTLDGVTWGRNSAHLAAATHQPPYRRLYPATALVGS